MCINDLKYGDKAFVGDILGSSKLNKRLLALGCTKGTEITFKGKAPLGDPILISIRGFNIALRKKDAKNIIISDIKEDVYAYNCFAR